jgi:8-oxo-dGTP pyrophosphatase MutT (NUDIX family)
MIETESAGGVVLGKGGRILVVSQHGSSWSLPKGHVEKGENRLDAAIREIREETGIDQLEYIKSLGRYQRYRISKDGKGDDRTELKTIYMFLFRTTQERIGPIDPENPEARWVAKDRVESLLTHPKDKEFYVSILDKI